MQHPPVKHWLTLSDLCQIKGWLSQYPLVNIHSLRHRKWSSIVDLPIKHGVFHSCKRFPEAKFVKFGVFPNAAWSMANPCWTMINKHHVRGVRHEISVISSKYHDKQVSPCMYIYIYFLWLRHDGIYIYMPIYICIYICVCIIYIHTVYTLYILHVWYIYFIDDHVNIAILDLRGPHWQASSSSSRKHC